MGKLVAILLAGVLSCAMASAQQLVIYPPPQGIIYSHHNDDYTVKARTPKGEWKDLYEYNVKVDPDKPQDASMAYFDCSGPVEVAVRKNNGPVQSVKVRPSAKGITTSIKGNTVFFTLPKPCKVSVEFNEDKLHNLHLFANPIETSRPDPKDTNVVYFGPGIHTPKDTIKKAFYIPSGKTVYIAGGAIVRGVMVCDSVHDVRIIGRGIIDQPIRGIEINYSSNITIDGIIVVNPRYYTVCGGQSDHITIRNLKSFSARGWGDGIDMMSCSEITIDDVFMRNSDDCIAVYGHRWNFYGDARNYKITNAILWADVAHPINIGIHGNTAKEGEVIENLVFKDIDILEHDEDDPDYQGCMAITDGDLNLIRNVRFENIRIDDFEEGQLFNLSVVFNAKYNTGPGRGIQNIHFKNISYTGSNLNPAVIRGYDATHGINNVTLEHITINGQPVKSIANAPIKVGPHVTGLIIKP